MGETSETQSSVESSATATKIWEGDVVGPKWTKHEKFLLRRQRAQITGYYLSEPSNLSVLGGPKEVVGSISADGRVRIMSEGGLVWNGRLSSPYLIEGKKPNGIEGNSPEFPFLLHEVRDAVQADLPAPLPATNSNWDEFITHFKSAATRRNRAALTGMLTRKFFLQNSRLRNAGDVFVQLRWKELDKTLAVGSIARSKSPIGREQKSIIDAHPCPGCGYAVMVSFRRDYDGQWRWSGIAYPGD